MERYPRKQMGTRDRMQIERYKGDLDMERYPRKQMGKRDRTQIERYKGENEVREIIKTGRTRDTVCKET